MAATTFLFTSESVNEGHPGMYTCKYIGINQLWKYSLRDGCSKDAI